ncbi:O-fucosyltransferase family protein [Aquabacterium sp.]|uniref:O-fucosyltransferase family protein n=1 Tax=Aquabacterium sp. TaxID=1872578 RepID=UPI0035B20524
MSMDLAQAAFDRGNYQKADMLCRLHIKAHPDDQAPIALLRRIYETLGLSRMGQYSSDAPRYLLIKAWGFGFWSDLDHVLGSLLVAELTHRTPVVYWGKNSLFRDANTVNAFESFFQPVSEAKWADLTRAGQRYYPPKWQAQNLQQEDVAKWTGPGSRLSGLYLLARDEEVVVSDYHTKINDLLHWIPEGHPLSGLSRIQIYRQLFQKYIHLRPELTQLVDSIWQKYMGAHNWLAVHVRGTDKVLEMGNLDAINGLYHDRIQRILDVNPSLNLFLLTDSTAVVDEYQVRWKGRVLTLPCQRGQAQTGVHLEGHPGTELGVQVILDAWLAGRCDFFLGNGGSNVSTGIRHLKDWGKGTYFLLGPDFLEQIDLSLHDW